MLISKGLDEKQIISLAEYKKHLGVALRIYCAICFIPSMVSRVNKYLKRNGLMTTVNKIKQRLKQ